jgi:hypothetical protein
MLGPDAIRAALRSVLASGVVRIARSNETAADFGCDLSRVPEHVLVRHLIEHVLRIRLFRTLDAHAMRLLSAMRPEICVIWDG